METEPFDCRNSKKGTFRFEFDETCVNLIFIKIVDTLFCY